MGRPLYGEREREGVNIMEVIRYNNTILKFLLCDPNQLLVTNI